MTAPDRPVLRYYGGKWRLAPWILRHFPPHEVYVEPFGGSAAVLLQKPESPLEVWNDLGLEVYNFFAVLRDEALCARLVRALEFTPWHREEFERCYAGLGEPQNDPVERARRFFVVSWQGVGASVGAHPSWRHVLHARYHDVPSHTWSFDHLLAASRRLRRVQLEHRDALEVMARYDSADTLFYLDPPYLVGPRSKRVRYEVDGMDEGWHRGLLEAALTLRGMVILSGYPNPLYEEVLEKRGWKRVETLSRGNGMRRGAKVEALWLSPRVSEGLGRLF